MNDQNLSTYKKKRSIFRFLTGGRVYLINKQFQYRFMASIVLLMVFSMAIVYGANYYFFETFISKGQSLNLPANHTFFVLINQQQQFMAKVFIGVAVILSTVTSIWGMLYSHRIAGPLYRLNLYFKDAAMNHNEKLPPVNFRKNDFFQEIPVSINHYFNSIEKKEENERVEKKDKDQESINKEQQAS